MYVITVLNFACQLQTVHMWFSLVSVIARDDTLVAGYRRCVVMVQ